MKSTFELNPRVIVWLLFATGAAILALTGCDAKTKSGFETTDEAEAEVVSKPKPLNLLAIAVPNFGDEVARQWAAQRDGELKITHASLDELEKDSLASGYDLIVHPAAANADLVSGREIRVYPREGLTDAEMNLDAFLMHFRKSLVRHDDKTWSVSLGGNQLRLFYRRDILEAADISVPETWEELGDAISKLETVDAAKGLKPIVVPTADGMAAQMFIARVASLIRDQGKLTSFFDRRTMKPMIAAVPFEIALEDVRRLSTASGGSFSVAEAFDQFALGKAVFAIAWPAAGDSIDEKTLEENSANWGVVRLPGSNRTYDLKDPSWRDRGKEDDPRVDLLGVTAINVSITASSSNSKDAVEFVKWLTDKQNSRKLLRDFAAPFRATHLGRIGQWYSMENADRGFLDELADAVEQTHRSRIVLMFPQLPGKHKYLGALNKTVLEFVTDKGVDAADALQKLATEWEELTEELDREGQIYHLRRSNGI